MNIINNINIFSNSLAINNIYVNNTRMYNVFLNSIGSITPSKFLNVSLNTWIKNILFEGPQNIIDIFEDHEIDSLWDKIRAPWFTNPKVDFHFLLSRK